MRASRSDWPDSPNSYMQHPSQLGYQIKGAHCDSWERPLTVPTGVAVMLPLIGLSETMISMRRENFLQS